MPVHAQAHARERNYNIQGFFPSDFFQDGKAPPHLWTKEIDMMEKTTAFWYMERIRVQPEVIP